MAQIRLKADSKMLSMTDYRTMVRTIRKVEPELIKRMRKNIREVAAPAQSAVKQNIPSVAPLSGMIRVHHGTKTWNYGAPAKSVVTDVKTSGRTNKKGYVTLGRLRVRSGATAIADMAGRSGNHVNKWTATRPYMYRYYRNGQPIDAPRQHRINDQGARMIDKLNERYKKASRFAWPAFEKIQPAVRAKAMVVLSKLADDYNAIIRKG